MKVLWGSLAVDGSGKLGGHVYAKNRGGNYVRTKTKPLNPQTLAQTSVRNDFTANAQAWRGLTDAQRQTWASAIASFPKKNSLGSSISLSGSNLFQRVNQNLRLVGATPLDTAPLPSAVTPITSLSLAADSVAPSMSLTFAPSPVPANYKLVIEATPGQSAGRTFVKNKYRRIQIVAAAGTSPANILAAYTAKFGSPIAGTKVFVRAKMIDTTNGFESQYISAEAVVS